MGGAPSKTKSIIAIVGRPNTGKSTLFNKLIGERKAITSEFEGTTRDRITNECAFGNLDVLLVDTGGLEFQEHENIEEEVQIQAKIAISDADLVIFLISAKELLTSDDYQAAELLRKSGKEVFLVANKCDVSTSRDKIVELYGLGFGDPIEISAIHGTGMDYLKNKIIDRLKKLGFKKNKITKKKDSDIKITFAGRPNVGKSSLVNAFFNEEKVIVSDISGTTRDAIDLKFEYEGHKFILIDTPGIRSPGKRERRLEKYSVIRSLESIERADVVLLILDYKEGLAHQDCYVANSILKAGTGLIIVVNKSDLMESKQEDMDKFLLNLQSGLKFAPWAPVIFVSAKNKKNINKIFDLATSIKENRQKRISTAELNSFVADCVMKHHPTGTKLKKPKILYVTEVDVEPPHFIFFVNSAKSFHFSYKRYLENQLREKYGFEGTVIKIEFRGKPTRAQSAHS
ncbi:ribosome biogenesis GTPase Der [Candidatus Peregrinibacteria bacterium RIFOXYB2_FULL_32_7]|nr:MAG: ribosome biogenesis GTPase Der [Candidatus Peregrinibacteria bacterium RIFOXYB2_FULL_32_7]